MDQNRIDGGDAGRPPEADEVLRALRSQQVDAIVSDRGVALVRLREVEDELAKLNAILEDQVADRTALLARQTRRLRQLTSEVIEAEERERQRIARILHDGVQQMLAAAEFQVDSVCSSGELSPKLEKRMTFVHEVLRDAMSQTRELSHDLAGPDIESRGLAHTLRHTAEEMARKHDLTVETDIDEAVDDSDLRTQSFLFRSAQELLFNVVKHAGSQTARLICKPEGTAVVLTVADAGRGFDPTALDNEGSEKLGLAGLRARSADFGAWMTIESAPDWGTTVTISCPIRAGDDA